MRLLVKIQMLVLMLLNFIMAAAGGHVNNALGYHYHGDTGNMFRIEQEGGHAAMVGYALDAHGIYAQLDADGNEAESLDDCNGHYDDTRGYHYHTLLLGNNEFFVCDMFYRIISYKFAW